MLRKKWEKWLPFITLSSGRFWSQADITGKQDRPAQVEIDPKATFAELQSDAIGGPDHSAGIAGQAVAFKTADRFETRFHTQPPV